MSRKGKIATRPISSGRGNASGLSRQWTIGAAVLLAGLYYGSEVPWNENWLATIVQCSVLVAVALSERFLTWSIIATGTALLILYVAWPTIDAAPAIVSGYALLIVAFAVGRPASGAIWAVCHLALAGLHLSVNAATAELWCLLMGNHLLLTAVSSAIGCLLGHAERRRQRRESNLLAESERLSSSAARSLHDSVAQKAAQALWLTRELQQDSTNPESAEKRAQAARACEAVVYEARQVMKDLAEYQPSDTVLHQHERSVGPEGQQPPQLAYGGPFHRDDSPKRKHG